MNRADERRLRLLHRGGVAVFTGFDEAEVIFLGELGVDRQPNTLRRIIARPRQADRELDNVTGVDTRLDVSVELLRSEDLFEERAELDLTPGAARLDVGEHLLQVAYTARQASHLAEALLYGFEAIADELERLAKSLFEGCFEAFRRRPGAFGRASFRCLAGALRGARPPSGGAVEGPPGSIR